MNFSDYDWKPLVAWSKQELMDYRARLDWRIKNLDKELDRRGKRDEMKHGFPIQVPGENGVGITTAYQYFDTAVEAYNAARERWPNDDSAPYKVHPVYLGKDDFKGQLDLPMEG